MDSLAIAFTLKMKKLLLIILLAASLIVAAPSAASAMSQASASYWINVDAALRCQQIAYCYQSTAHASTLRPWGGAFGTYGWSAFVAYARYGRVACNEYINTWGSTTQEGWNVSSSSC